MATSIPRSDQYEGDEMKSMKEAIDHPALQDMAPRAGVAAVVVLAAVVAGVGYVIYKRRQRRTLLERLQDALPEMDDVRARLKRPLKRAVRVL
jgi:negative regulator of sigma E activity